MSDPHFREDDDREEWPSPPLSMILIIFMITSIVGGLGAPLIKFTSYNFHPLIFVLSRAILATLLVSPFILSKIDLPRKNIKTLFLANTLFAANWLFFAIGIQHTTVIMSQLLYIPTSLIVAIIGLIFLREKLTKEQILGLALTIIGFVVFTLGYTKSSETLSFGTPLGNLIVSLAVICWASYIVVSRKISKIYRPTSILFFNFAASTFLILLLAPYLFLESEVKLNISPESVTAIFSTVLFSSVLFFYLVQWLIKNTSAFISSLFIYPASFVSALVGVFFYNEKLVPSLIIGGILIMSGVFVATSYQKIKKWTFQ